MIKVTDFFGEPMKRIAAQHGKSEGRGVVGYPSFSIGECHCGTDTAHACTIEAGYEYHITLQGGLLQGQETDRDVFMVDSIDHGPIHFQVPRKSKSHRWIFEESNGQHGHRCSVCTDWINYDCGQTSCRCGHASPYNPLRDRIKFLEAVITAYEELFSKQSNLVRLLKR